MKPKLILCLALVLSGSFLVCHADETNVITAVAPQAAAVAKVKLKFVKVDSEETNSQNGYGENAVDGNPNTYWHTQWHGTSPGLPHEIIVEVHPPSVIKGFTYLPRQDESDHGTIKDYEFYVSDDGRNFGQPVKKGAFEPGKGEKIETFEPIKCRYIKHKAISEINGLPWTSAAEIGVISVGENTDLMTNCISQANTLLAEFEKTKSVDQLEAAYLAVGNIPEPGVDETVSTAVARREKTRMLFKLLAVIDQNIDANSDMNDSTNWPVVNMYYPGVELELAKDPIFRAKFEAAVKQNDEKTARLYFQTRLHNIDQSANFFVRVFLQHSYTTSRENQTELENLMKQAKLSPARIQKIKTLFESTNPDVNDVDAHLAKQVCDTLIECQKIKPGTTRAELLKVFTTEGGLSTPARRTFVYRGCPYIKIDVDFTDSDPNQKMIEERPTDTISKISKPYLEWSIID